LGFLLLNISSLNFYCIFAKTNTVIMESRVEEQELTHEELQARKEEMLQFYTESIPYLNAQFQHEELLMKIDKARFERAQYQLQYAMMMNPPQESESPEELREEISKERKLKKS
jgi:hypothetical protein